MSQITLQQALFYRPDHEPPHLVAQSSGFNEAWLPETHRLMLGFGEREGARRCPLTIFAKPVTARHVAIVRVIDQQPGNYPEGLRFHFLVVEVKDYEFCIRDPFMLAEKVEPTWEARESLPALMIPQEAFTARTLAQVQQVLKRVKASALREGEDPESPDFERTAENSESPALLGGTQVLVDGGRLIFERPQGDLPLVAGLWLLLPEMTRCRRWPASFAFSTALDFDVVVVPHLDEEMLEGYTTEEQASSYPDGSYEFALQRAAETGTQGDLDAVFRKRDGHQTLRLAIAVLLLVSGLVLFSRWMDADPPGPGPNPLSVQQQKVAAAAGIVTVADPWTALGMVTYGKYLWDPKK